MENLGTQNVDQYRQYWRFRDFARDIPKNTDTEKYRKNLKNAGPNLGRNISKNTGAGSRKIPTEIPIGPFSNFFQRFRGHLLNLIENEGYKWKIAHQIAIQCQFLHNSLLSSKSALFDLPNLAIDQFKVLYGKAIEEAIVQHGNWRVVNGQQFD